MMANVRNDSITGSAILDHLTLGVVNTLQNLQKVRKVQLKTHLPCESAQIAAWEEANDVRLPNDMKRFYQTTDGLNVRWTFRYSQRKQKRVGHLKIPHLARIRNPITNQPKKVFLFDRIGDEARIYLMYETPDSTCPKFYLFETKTLRHHLLADTFTQYYRMAIAHLGLPCWQLSFASRGLPEWAEQLFRVLAPHLLEKDDMSMPEKLVYETEQPNPNNVLDPDIFRTKARRSRDTSK